MTERERMEAGLLYMSADPEIKALQRQCLELLYTYNHTRPSDVETRKKLLTQMFREVGEGTYIEPPLHANWAGRHVTLGKHVYFNFGVVLVDDTSITIGDNTMIGPNCVLSTAAHPLNPPLRARHAQFELPITIGKNVWLGAGVIVKEGVTIGDNAVVGAGSVVTHDIPRNSLAYGQPCRVIRTFNEHDLTTYRKTIDIDIPWAWGEGADWEATDE